MTTKPPAGPKHIKPEDVLYGAGFAKKLNEYLDQFEPEHVNRRLRELYSNELAFLDVPEVADFLDDEIVADADVQEQGRAEKKTGT